MSNPYEEDGQIVVEPRTHHRVQRPRMYRVLVHNDDYTTREFVVEVLCQVFHHSETQAVQIMLHVHHNGLGVAGVFTREVAETKIRVVEQLAREREYPLRLTMEPEDDDDSEDAG